MELEFPNIWNLFGGSIYRDEYRGDFADADRRIRLALSSIPADDHNARAGLELARAIHALLTGHIRETESILNHLRSQESSLSEAWQLRAEIYRRLIVQNGSILHAFDNSFDLPDFQSILTATLYPKDGSRLGELQPFRNGLHNLEDEWILLDIWAIKLRTRASMIPEISPIHAREVQDLRMNQNIVEKFEGTLAGYRVGYPRKLHAELAHIQGFDTDVQFLDEAESIYVDAKDLTGQAACLLTRGDWACSQQFGNITALNIMICESSAYDGASPWDLFEDKLKVGDMLDAQKYSDAEKFYDEALSLFERANACRGRAAVHLCRACLILLQLVFVGSANGGAGAHARARESLDEAKKLFRTAGDCLSLRLVETHQIILDIMIDSVSSQAAKASEIGAWGAEHGCVQYVHDLGLLLL
jgi:hypothetical protein